MNWRTIIAGTIALAVIGVLAFADLDPETRTALTGALAIVVPVVAQMRPAVERKKKQEDTA